MGGIGVILRVPLSDEADFVGAELFAVCKMLRLLMGCGVLGRARNQG